MVQLLAAYLAKAFLVIAAAALITRFVALSAAMRHGLWTIGFAAALFILPLSLLAPPVHLGLRPDGPAGAVLNLAVLAWLAVAMLLLGRIILDQLGLARLRRRTSPVSDRATLDLARRVKAEMRLSRAVRLRHWEGSMPATFGILRPVILLPAAAPAWPAERLRLTLLHEMGHVARRDADALLLSRIAAALHWWNPICLWAFRDARRICEFACDDLVLRTNVKPRDYARTLIETARDNAADKGSRRFGVLTMTAARGLEARIVRLFSPPRRVSAGRAAFLLCAAMLLIIGAMTAPARLETGTGWSYAP